MRIANDTKRASRSGCTGNAKAQRGRSTILVVDDDAAMRDSLRETLEEEGHSVLLAADGNDALGQLEARHDVAVVLLDVMMPVMNGLEFLAAKSRDGRICDIPVVLMTAYHLDERPIVGVSAKLTKPFKMKAMLQKVEELVAPK